MKYTLENLTQDYTEKHGEDGKIIDCYEHQCLRFCFDIIDRLQKGYESKGPLYSKYDDNPKGPFYSKYDDETIELAISSHCSGGYQTVEECIGDSLANDDDNFIVINRAGRVFYTHRKTIDGN